LVAHFRLKFVVRQRLSDLSRLKHSKRSKMPSRRQQAATHGRNCRTRSQSFVFLLDGYAVPIMKIESQICSHMTVNGLLDNVKAEGLLFPQWAASKAWTPRNGELQDLALDRPIPRWTRLSIAILLHLPEIESETEAPPTEAPEPESEASASEDEQVNLSALL
jgi:hypothetical protein